MPNEPARAAHEMSVLASRATSFDDRWWVFANQRLSPNEVVAILGGHLTEDRQHRIEEVLDQRTYRLAVVVEGMVDTGNVAAVMRSADAFGVQPFHAVDTAGTYKHSKRTTQGAEKWLDRWRWRSPDDVVRFLRSSGYRIAVTDSAGGAVPIDRVDFGQPTALVFGNELKGVSAAMRSAADLVTSIPMFGFSQSFNLSVAAAICLHAARSGRSGDLSNEDRSRLRAVWYQQSVRHSRRLIEHTLAASGGSVG